MNILDRLNQDILDELGLPLTDGVASEGLFEGDFSSSIAISSSFLGQIGVSGEFKSSLDDVESQFRGIIKSERIYHIIITTRTGRAIITTTT